MLQIVPLASQALRIVVADDSEGDRKRVIDLLRSERNIVVDEANDVGRLLAIIDDQQVDCVLIDKVLGDESGFAVLERVMATRTDPPAMIMLTGSGNERIAVKAFRCGFDNYVTKSGLNSGELTTAILHATGRRLAVRQQEEELHRLSAHALRDRMTGLPNRQYLQERLNALVESGQRRTPTGMPAEGMRFAVLMIGIDSFKRINDAFGHTVGQSVLKAFADRLRTAAAVSECYGRFHADTFLNLIEGDVSPEAIDSAANRLVEALAFPIQLDAVGLDLSACIGVAIYPADGADAETLLLEADRAMRAAGVSGNGYALAASLTQIEESGATAGRASSPADALAPGGGTRMASGPEEADDEDGFDPAHRADNRRSERRNRVLKRALVVADNGFSTVDCVIHDLSVQGACIIIEAEYAPPASFRLRITANGDEFRAEKRWQKGRTIGVRFLD